MWKWLLVGLGVMLVALIAGWVSPISFLVVFLGVAGWFAWTLYSARQVRHKF